MVESDLEQVKKFDWKKFKSFDHLLKPPPFWFQRLCGGGDQLNSFLILKWKKRLKKLSHSEMDSVIHSGLCLCVIFVLNAKLTFL